MNEPAPLPVDDPIELHRFLGMRYYAPGPNDTTAEARMPITAASNGYVPDNLHGGALATLIDLACALAAAPTSGFDPATQAMVTTDLHVRYVGRARGDEVIARAEVVRSGRSLIVIECRVHDSEGRLVASADVGMMLVPLHTRTGGELNAP